MPTYIGFLRAVNVGKRQYPMAQCRAALEQAGFEDVASHIQTGNVRVKTPTRSRAKVESELERVFEADRGFEVPTIVLTPKELADLAAEFDKIAGDDRPKSGHYVSVLRDSPTTANAKVIEDFSTTDERLLVRGRVVHHLYDIPFHEARNMPVAVTKAFGVTTNRNAKVIRALAEKWGA